MLVKTIVRLMYWVIVLDILIPYIYCIVEYSDFNFIRILQESTLLTNSFFFNFFYFMVIWVSQFLLLKISSYFKSFFKKQDLKSLLSSHLLAFVIVIFFLVIGLYIYYSSIPMNYLFLIFGIFVFEILFVIVSIYLKKHFFRAMSPF